MRWLLFGVGAALALWKARQTQRRRRYVLGFDFSTQSLTLIVLHHESNKPIFTKQLVFDREFPEFQTTTGVIRGRFGEGEVSTPFALFCRALERALNELPLEIKQNLVAISGSAQQHCSVYWNVNELLRMNSEHNLEANLQPQLARADCPSWMDHSTTALCQQLESTVMSPLEIKNISGSRAFERFTGVQICKQLLAGVRVKRVTLLSNAMCSVLCGKFTPADTSDACGMNLLNVRTGEWSQELCLALGALVNFGSLRPLLGEENPSPANSVMGKIAPYFVQRFGLPSHCKIVQFTGDNPSTVQGMNLQRGDCVISLGSSTTVLSIVDDFDYRDLESHIMRNPSCEKSYVEMYCFKNGSLPRDEFFVASWKEFDLLIESGAETNCIAFVYPQVEITPLLKRAGVMCFDANDKAIDFAALPRNQALVALLHGQIFAMAHRVLIVGQQRRIFVCGGGSKSRALVQIMANCFQLSVSITSNADAACLGAAYRALTVITKFTEETQQVCAIHHPAPHSAARYAAMLKRYAGLEQRVKIGLG